MQLTKLFNTTAFRLSILTAAAFAVTAALVVGYIVPRATDVMTRQVMETIAADAKGLREQYASGGLAQLQSVIANRVNEGGTSLYFLMAADGRKLAGNLNRAPPELATAPKGGTFSYSLSDSSPIETIGALKNRNASENRSLRGPGRSINSAGAAVADRLAAGLVIDIPGGVKLLVGRDIEAQRVLAQRVKWAMLAGLTLLLLIAVGGGLLVSRHVLSRIDDVTRTSRRIMAGDMSGRIPVNGSDDELDRLSLSLNAMLERIEQLMAGVREVSDNIAHDLRTPLNRLRNRAEAALRDGRGQDDFRDALERTIEEADGLIKTFNALLSISRLEAGAGTDDMEPMDLSAIVRDVGELYEPAAEEAGFRLDVAAAGDIAIKGNRQLIGQLLANLIDNAIKYSARHDTPPAEQEREVAEVKGAGPDSRPVINDRDLIEVSLRKAGGLATITVADRGPGISAENRERALERFVRLDESRSRPGSGLGLALASAVARLHGGEVRLEDNEPGLRVVIQLPILSDYPDARPLVQTLQREMRSGSVAARETEDHEIGDQEMADQEMADQEMAAPGGSDVLGELTPGDAATKQAVSRS